MNGSPRPHGLGELNAVSPSGRVWKWPSGLVCMQGPPLASRHTRLAGARTEVVRFVRPGDAASAAWRTDSSLPSPIRPAADDDRGSTCRARTGPERRRRQPRKGGAQRSLWTRLSPAASSRRVGGRANRRRHRISMPCSAYALAAGECARCVAPIQANRSMSTVRPRLERRFFTQAALPTPPRIFTAIVRRTVHGSASWTASVADGSHTDCSGTMSFDRPQNRQSSGEMRKRLRLLSRCPEFVRAEKGRHQCGMRFAFQPALAGPRLLQAL